MGSKKGIQAGEAEDDVNSQRQHDFKHQALQYRADFTTILVTTWIQIEKNMNVKSSLNAYARCKQRDNFLHQDRESLHRWEVLLNVAV